VRSCAASRWSRSRPGSTSVVAGTLIGFTAYAWLLRNAPISKVVTHQYVNPLVAIALGRSVLDEQLTLDRSASGRADRRIGLRRRAARTA
jgi:EamA domain-containing membrane protein RarD